MHKTIIRLALTAAISIGVAEVPPGFVVPSGFDAHIDERSYVAFDTRTFDDRQASGRSMQRKVEGRTWQFELKAKDGRKPDVALAVIEASLQSDGWAIVRDKGRLVAKKQVSGSTEWFRIDPHSTTATVLLEAKAPRVVTPAAPHAEKETVTDDHDFTYAPPMPGAQLLKTSHGEGLFVHPKGTSRPLELVPVVKWYEIPRDISMYEFVQVNREAFRKAGWSIERESVGSEALLLAHYTKNGRDLWLYDYAVPGQQRLAVADMVETPTCCLPPPPHK